jgi:putative transposase
VHAELVYGHGITVGHNAVSLLMRRAGLAGLPTPTRGKRSRKLATVTDLVRRDFHRADPNQLQFTDITEHPTREGKVYCCVVRDVWSRRVAGWAIDSTQRADLATNALGMALDSRVPAAGGIIHGKHGAQFASWTFTERARKAGAAIAGHHRRPVRQRGRSPGRAVRSRRSSRRDRGVVPAGGPVVNAASCAGTWRF